MNPIKHVNHKALATTLLSFLRLKAGNRLLSAPTHQAISMAERKRVVEEGNGYLREASDLINGNRNHLAPDVWASLDHRWSEIYTRAPKPGKLTRGRLDPEDFCEQSRELLHDTQEALEMWTRFLGMTLLTSPQKAPRVRRVSRRRAALANRYQPQ
ncbi:hypothetical protein BD779DRAFT_331845 [Infundibulicybe gibba]|nr:hypothetical protein BD779DRAFT_331845 [Infundibulicybe gibba]